MSKQTLPLAASNASASGLGGPPKARGDTQDRSFVTALARGLDILRCFDRPGLELGVSEIARLVGLTQPTAWRLCQTLISCGYLVKAAAGGALRIGAPALTLGYAAIHGQSFPAIALPYMRQITERCLATTTLSVRQEMEMISVQSCPGEFVLPNQPVGWRGPLIAVPSGLAVLAAMAEPRRHALMLQIEAQDPDHWPHRRERLDRASADYRRQGFVIMEGMVAGQYSGVSVPLLAPAAEGQGEWGFTCGGLASRWTTAALSRVGEELVRVGVLLQPAVAHAA